MIKSSTPSRTPDKSTSKGVKKGGSETVHARGSTNKASLPKPTRGSGLPDLRGKSITTLSIPHERFEIKLIVYHSRNQNHWGVLFDCGELGNSLVDAPRDDNISQRHIRHRRDVPLSSLTIIRNRFVADLAPLDISRYYELVNQQIGRWIVTPLFDDMSWWKRLLQDVVDAGLINVDVDEVVRNVNNPPLA